MGQGNSVRAHEAVFQEWRVVPCDGGGCVVGCVGNKARALCKEQRSLRASWVP